MLDRLCSNNNFFVISHLDARIKDYEQRIGDDVHGLFHWALGSVIIGGLRPLSKLVWFTYARCLLTTICIFLVFSHRCCSEQVQNWHHPGVRVAAGDVGVVSIHRLSAFAIDRTCGFQLTTHTLCQHVCKRRLSQAGNARLPLHLVRRLEARGEIQVCSHSGQDVW